MAPGAGQRVLPPAVVATYVAARTDGRRDAHLWSRDGATPLEQLASAMSQLRQELGEVRAGQVDALEIDLAHGFAPVVDTLDHNQRGLLGFEVARGPHRTTYAPTRMITTNRSASRVVEVFHDAYGGSGATEDLSLRGFDADQFLVVLQPVLEAHRLERGNQTVHVSEVDRSVAQAWVDGAVGWLRNNVHADGRMTYAYWPSAGTEAPPSTHNMIRQWMATVALGRSAAARDDGALKALLEANIRYNLAHFYETRGDLGVIQWNGKVKLGALAIAAMALSEHPERHRWAAERAGLERAIDTLWNEDGSFRTFLEPADRNDNQNFYPGEALLFLAGLYDTRRDPDLLARLMRSFRYYRAWHLDPANRNPAFVPWHTQAYFTLWSVTGDAELAEFIFEMNDWLVELQQWDGAPHPDMEGRFYARGGHFGPPHASATGVYMEGLIDAFALARRVGDSVRAERYRLALVRGLRSQLQLQFADEVDMFYVGVDQRPYVEGGVRTTVYDNRVRCDNVQHPLMALLMVLERFEAADFLHAPPG